MDTRTAAGFETYAIDLIGRGNSDGDRFYIADADEIVSHIDQLVSIVIESG